MLRLPIRRMATEDSPRGHELAANELLVKHRILSSPRTVVNYTSKRPPGRPLGDRRGGTYPRKKGKAIITRDSFVATTANFRAPYVFVVPDGTLCLLRLTVRATPPAARPRRQLGEATGLEDGYRSAMHDREQASARTPEEAIGGLGLQVSKSPVQVSIPNPDGELRRRAHGQHPPRGLPEMVDAAVPAASRYAPFASYSTDAGRVASRALDNASISVSK